MFKLLRAPAPAEPRPFLKAVACEFAPRVAEIWPAPHGEFLTASAGRRHLVCLAIAVGGEPGRLHGVLAAGRLRDLVRLALAKPPPGLVRALERMGEAVWSAPAYRRFVELLADRQAGKALRHADVIDGAAIVRLARLPAPMALSLRLAGAMTDDGAVVVAEAAEAIAWRWGPAAAQAAASRWALAETEASLFSMVREDIYPDLPPPPFAGTRRLRPLATKPAMRDAARRFQNCLADRISHAVSGFSAYYEWTDAPGAIVEVGRDPVFGWRLEAASGHGNEPLDRETREALVAELRTIGVHAGRSGWQLERALGRATGRTWALPTVAQDLADVFE